MVRNLFLELNSFQIAWLGIMVDVTSDLDEHRKDRMGAGHKAVWNVMVLTDVQEASSAELSCELLRKLEDVEITPSNTKVWQVHIQGNIDNMKDEATLRGGFTTQERKQANKVPLSCKVLQRGPRGKGKNRILKPPDLQSASCKSRTRVAIASLR